MTKKHFIQLAEMVRDEIAPAMSTSETEIVVEALCRFCRNQNPRFCESTFRGYIAGECGPCGGKVRK